jgi:hypothetical protein
MAVTIHFCNDPTAWRYLIPALLDLPVSQFQWETCRHPAGLTLARVLLESSTFSFVPAGAEEYVAEWIDIYGLEKLSQKVAFQWWGTTELTVNVTQMPPLTTDIDGFVFSLSSRYRQTSLRSLLTRRGLHPMERLKLRRIMLDVGGTLSRYGWQIPALPNRPTGLEALLAGSLNRLEIIDYD